MFLGLTNTPRDYAWGSRTAIAEVLGRPASGGPEAELWFGAHPEAPSTVTDASPDFAGRRLDQVIAGDPAGLLGPGRSRMPFLMKVLAADEPLSLQVHPDAQQAREGFARENEARIAPDAVERNYRDDSHKPELILALSQTFEALAGFRHVSETRMLLAELETFADAVDRPLIAGLTDELAAGDPVSTGSTGSSTHVIADGMPSSGDTTPEHGGEGNPLAAVVERLLRRGDGVDRLVAAISAAASRASDNSSFAREWATVQRLGESYPGDPGVVIALLLNRVSLAQGQVLSLPAGVIHAYLEGVGIELMASSDNVLRGGLTKKHVDVDELLRVARFEATPTPAVRPDSPAPGITVWRTEGDDFVLAQVALGDAASVHGYELAGPESTAFDLTGPAVVLALSGGLRLSGGTGDFSLAQGDAVYVTPDEGTLAFAGSGVAVVATTP